MRFFRKVPFLLLLLPLVAAILVWRYAMPESFYPADPACVDKEGSYLLHIQSVPKVRNANVRFEASLVPMGDSVTAGGQESRTLCYVRADSAASLLQQGDWLVAHTTPRHSNAGNPDEFDYDGWLRQQGITSVCFVQPDAWQQTGHQRVMGLRARAERAQQRIVRLLEKNGVRGSELGVLSALTVGDKDRLSPDTRQRWSAAGAAHVLAVSGLHTGIIYFAIQLLLTGFGLAPVLYRQRWRKRLNVVLLILALWAYAFLTGLSPSVVRAALMFSLFAIGGAMERDTNTYNIIFAAAFLTLLFSPQSLFNISFQLSYTAVLSIVFFHQRIASLWHPRWRVVRWAWELLVMSVAAQLGTLPLTLYYFSQTSNLFFLTNWVVIPAAEVILYTFLLFLLLSPTPAARWIGWLIGKEVWLTDLYVGFVERLPGSTTSFSISIWMAALLVLAVLMLALSMTRRRGWVYGIAALCAVAGFLGLHAERMHRVSKTQQMVIYNCRYNLIFLQQGRSCMLLTDSADAALRLTEPHRKKQMLHPPQVVDISGKGVYSFRYENKDYLWLLGDVFRGNELRDTVACDVLLVSYLPPWEASALDKIRRQETVLMPALPQWQKREWEKP